MPGFTNRCKYNICNIVFRAATAPTQFNLALITSATAPTAAINLFSELTEIAAGNGYTSGGAAVTRNATGFDVLTEDDVNNRGYVQLADVAWTASGGPIPASGSGARYCTLLDNNATVGSREVWAWGDLGADQSVSAGQTLTLQNFELRIND